MSSLRARRRALTVMVVAVAASLGVGLAALTATSDERSKPGPDARDGVAATTPAAPPGETSSVPAEGDVPVRATPPAGASCPTGWSYFDNTALRYGLCVPPGWGFSDFTSLAPLDRIPIAQLDSLHLLGNAFPWRPGTMPFDAVRAGAFDIELDAVPPNATASGECAPSNTLLVGDVTFLTCEQLYDDAGLPALVGSLRAIKALVPLGDARLLVIARARATALPLEVSTLWQIIRSIRVY